MINSIEDLLTCRRNELMPDSPHIRKSGIEGLLEYRLSEIKMPPESIWQRYDEDEHKYVGRSKAAEYIGDLYGIDVFETGGISVIFNSWAYISRILRGMSREHWDNEEYVLEYLDDIFEGYEEIRHKLDKLADYHYSLANLMPAPAGFAYCRSGDGKGNPGRDNDMPDLYYRRAEKDFPQMFKWINDNMDAVSLQVFREYDSECEDGRANEPVSDDPVEWVPFERSIDDAIACIERRAERIHDRE
ncbi:MAG: hypothetical protein IJS12_00785 [Lachnospiraceae bacterium]|nr:hypothetical protein [Lachnospiraceae bacterium]